MVPPLLVLARAHVLAAARLVPLLRRVVRLVPPRAPRQRQHRGVAVGVHRSAHARHGDGRGRGGSDRGEQTGATTEEGAGASRGW